MGEILNSKSDVKCDLSVFVDRGNCRFILRYNTVQLVLLRHNTVQLVLLTTHSIRLFLFYFFL